MMYIIKGNIISTKRYPIEWETSLSITYLLSIENGTKNNININKLNKPTNMGHKITENLLKR